MKKYTVGIWFIVILWRQLVSVSFNFDLNASKRLYNVSLTLILCNGKNICSRFCDIEELTWQSRLCAVSSLLLFFLETNVSENLIHKYIRMLNVNKWLNFFEIKKSSPKYVNVFIYKFIFQKSLGTKTSANNFDNVSTKLNCMKPRKCIIY